FQVINCKCNKLVAVLHVMVFQRPVENLLGVASDPEVFSIEFKPYWDDVGLTLAGDGCYPSQALRLQVLSFRFRKHTLHFHITYPVEVSGYIDWSRYNLALTKGLVLC